MQGDFEKRIQEKMAALNLTPSAPVWENIERQIQPEKKRRRFFLWLLLTALLLGGGWLVVAPLGGQKEGASLQKPAAVNNRSRAEATGHLLKPATPSGPKGFGKEKLPLPKTNKITRPTWPTVAVSKAASPPHKLQVNLAATRQTEKSIAAAGATHLFNPPAAEQKEATAQNKTASWSEPLPDGKNNAGVAGTKVQPTPVLPLPADTTKADTMRKQIALPVDSSTRKKIAANGKKWQQQLWLQLGWSDYAKGLALLPGAASRGVYASSLPGASYSTGTQPAAVSKGFSFAVGWGVTKSFSRHFAVTAGLQYGYAAVHSKEGEFRRIDTTVFINNSAVAINGYYRNTPPTNHTSSFHLLSLPVSLHYQPILSLPLQLSAGVAYGRLLQANALTVSSSGNISYYDKNNNNRDCLNLLAGLQYRAMANGHLTLNVGPQVQYSATRVQKQYAGRPAYLFFAGLKSSLNF